MFIFHNVVLGVVACVFIASLFTRREAPWWLLSAWIGMAGSWAALYLWSGI